MKFVSTGYASTIHAQNSDNAIVSLNFDLVDEKEDPQVVIASTSVSLSVPIDDMPAPSEIQIGKDGKITEPSQAMMDKQYSSMQSIIKTCSSVLQKWYDERNRQLATSSFYDKNVLEEGINGNITF